MSSITENIKGGPPKDYPPPATPPPARNMTGTGKVSIKTQQPEDTSKIPPPWH